jgi:hypothetical protein
MDEFLTWKYIVGVLVASVLINIFTHYFIPILDRVVGTISSQWKMRSEKSKRAHEALLDKCGEDPVLVSLLIHGQSMNIMVVLMCLIGALIVLVIGSSPILSEGEMLRSPEHTKGLTAIVLAMGTLACLFSIEKLTVLRDLRKQRLALAQPK